MSELNQFCILASSQKGLALSALIQQVLNSKKIYNFGELLAIPSVQGATHSLSLDLLTHLFIHSLIHSLTLTSLFIAALANQSEYAKSFATLELFAYGTYSDYMANSSRYLELTSEQGNKLRLLSIVSLASASHELHYSVLKGTKHSLPHSITYSITHSLTHRAIVHYKLARVRRHHHRMHLLRFNKRQN